MGIPEDHTDVPLPLTPAATARHRRFMDDWVKLCAQANEISLTVLIWGPSPTKQSAAARKRKEIRNELSQRGHDAQFPEDLAKDLVVELLGSTAYQEFHQLLAADFAVALVEDSEGASGEIHDFATHPDCGRKIFVLAPVRYRKGYTGATILLDLEQRFGGVRWYSPEDLALCHVMAAAVERVERQRRAEYLWQRYQVRIAP